VFLDIFLVFPNNTKAGPTRSILQAEAAVDDAALNHRLSQLSTCWTLLTHAHGGDADLKAQAQAALLERYQVAIYRYLVAALRDPDAADEVFQEFALRVVGGALAHADPARGRFRNYVKTSLSHLISWYRSKKARQQHAGLQEPEAVPAAPLDEAPDQAFLEGWRKALLDRAWEALAGCQRPDGPPFYDALKLRTEMPDLTTAQLMERLNAKQPSSYPVTEAGLRKILQRARELFTDLLLDEIARSLRDSSPDDLEQEVIDLGFHAYCRRALERRRQSNRQ
jgi:RNA polymerase sigma-70 factor (ECF subfamily)